MKQIAITGRIGDRRITIPVESTLTAGAYERFLVASAKAMQATGLMPLSQGIKELELAHLIPRYADSVLAAYVWRNTPWAEKLLRAEALVVHSHNNVLVLEKGAKIPEGCVDARKMINGFRPPTKEWKNEWIYAIILEGTPLKELFKTPGFIDIIPAKTEQFTMLSETGARVLLWVAESTLDNRANDNKSILKARRRGEVLTNRSCASPTLEGKEDLVPVVLLRGERLTIPPGSLHGWEEIDGAPGIVMEISMAAPIPGKPKSSGLLVPGSADLTTDVFVLHKLVFREPLLESIERG